MIVESKQLSMVSIESMTFDIRLCDFLIIIKKLLKYEKLFYKDGYDTNEQYFLLSNFGLSKYTGP